MKHPTFELLGSRYPHALEQKYDRILIKIEQLWDKPEIDDYFSDLLIDRRGGRQGFPKDVLADIVMLRELRELETFRKANEQEQALRELQQRGIKLNREDFLNAISSGDQALVDLFIKCNVNIHVTDDSGTPALILALKKGYSVIANILLNAGADVNAYDKMGMTPLLLACGKQTYGFKSVAESLIKRGAHINDRDRLGFTPLLLALSGGTYEIAEHLIEKGADVNARARNGQTALSLAKAAGNAYMTELLLIKGAKE